MSMVETIFLTGGTGLVGNRCLIRALSKGYHVIASVRSKEKGEVVRKAIEPVVDVSKLSFVVTPDMSVSGCFDEDFKGVDYVVHVASPLWTVTDYSDMNRTFVQCPIQGTTNILSAAKNSNSVKKVVLCSSLAALVTNDKSFGDDVDHKTYTAEDRIPDSFYASVKDGMAEHYFAGKTLTRNLTDRMVEVGLPFDVINIFPSSIIGRFEPARTTEEMLANSSIRGLAAALGRTLDPLPTSSIHLDDLAKMHVDVLAMPTQKYHNFGAGIDMSFEHQIGVVRKHFPEAVEKGIFPLDGKSPDRPFSFDASPTENFFGWKFKTFEDMVVDVATQYLELLEKKIINA